jgi:hypothetical protein
MPTAVFYDVQLAVLGYCRSHVAEERPVAHPIAAASQPTAAGSLTTRARHSTIRWYCPCSHSRARVK